MRSGCAQRLEPTRATGSVHATDCKRKKMPDRNAVEGRQGGGQPSRRGGWTSSTSRPGPKRPIGWRLRRPAAAGAGVALRDCKPVAIVILRPWPRALSATPTIWSSA
jgi:hypothetical protein